MPDLDNNSDPFTLLQMLLDILSDQPGAILYRGYDMWEALPPGNLGDALVIGPEKLPIWTPDV